MKFPAFYQARCRCTRKLGAQESERARYRHVPQFYDASARTSLFACAEDLDCALLAAGWSLTPECPACRKEQQ